MAFTPTDPTKAEVRVVGEAPNQSLDFYIPRGAKGEPGGIVLGTLLGAANLNDIKTSGVYRQTSAANSTQLNNYPEASLGVLIVHEVTATTHLEQEFRPFWFSPTLRHGQVFYRRQFVSGAWSSWKVFGATRVAETAGRVVYQWDNVNFREQIIWGDTGWRTWSPPINGVVTGGTVRFRRVNENVYLRFIDLQLSTAANGFGELIAAADVPVGFRPNGVERSMQSVGQTNNATYPQMISIYSSVGWLYQTIGIANSLSRPTAPLQGTVSWVTDEVWPTTLPGTAFNTIPNG